MHYRFAAVTGATSGIGEAIARALPESCDLLLTGRGAERLGRLEVELARPGRRIETLAADLARESDRDALVGRALALDIDLLVNNAGIGRVGRVAENPAAREREIVMVNVVAPVVLTRALLPGMAARARAAGRRAGMIMVSSTAGHLSLPRFATYASSKAFGLHYGEALAVEMADEPVDILALCPGGTDTRFFERAAMNGSAMGRLDPPERVAREALAALGRKRVHMVGARNRLAIWLAHHLPKRVVLSGAERTMRRLQME